MCLTKTHRPNVIFLSETRKNKEYVEGLRYRLGMKNVFSFSAKGKGGGLAVFWDDSYNLELNKFGSISLICIFFLAMVQNGEALLSMEKPRQVKGM